jgi:hydroxymethylbilane synthase
LARWQAEWVALELQRLGVATELAPIESLGDRLPVAPLSALGGVGVFTKQLQLALLAGEVDLAVHSLKDLPTQSVPGLALAAIPRRGPAADVVVTPRPDGWAALPAGAIVGTGSLRRRAQLWHVRSDLRMADVRGNVQTRLEKLERGQYDALVLAEAGLRRLGLDHWITEALPANVMLPAVGQGALAIETRADDAEALSLLAPLEHVPSRQAVDAERAVLASLQAGCLAPVAAHAVVSEALELELTAVVLSGDGAQRLAVRQLGDAADAASLGQLAAERLIAEGASELIQAARDWIDPRAIADDTPPAAVPDEA